MIAVTPYRDRVHNLARTILVAYGIIPRLALGRIGSAPRGRCDPTHAIGAGRFLRGGEQRRGRPQVTVAATRATSSRTLGRVEGRMDLPFAKNFVL